MTFGDNTRYWATYATSGLKSLVSLLYGNYDAVEIYILVDCCKISGILVTFAIPDKESCQCGLIIAGCDFA